VNEEALAHWELLRQKQTNKQTFKLTIFTPITYKLVTKMGAKNASKPSSTVTLIPPTPSYVMLKA
jgi:hypothetical protein